jgi:hypothetical protein
MRTPLLRHTLFAVALSVLALSSGLAVRAASAVTYDAPTVSLVDRGFFEVTLEVHAGASGAPSGFTIEWMKKSDYDLVGGWLEDTYDPRLVYCQFYDRPTLNLFGDEHATFQLPPDGSIAVQPGDLFDETGIETDYTTPLTSNTEYVFRAYVNGDANGDESAYSGDLSASTANAECTQGFWKNHPEVWPASATPMFLGTVSYTKTELLDIFNTPANGNGLISLAHQLITAKLNGANGSDLSPVAADIATADAMIGGLVVPPIGAGFLDPGTTSATTETLDDYNNGHLGGVIACATPTIRGSWGAIKAIYR